MLAFILFSSGVGETDCLLEPACVLPPYERMSERPSAEMAVSYGIKVDDVSGADRLNKLEQMLMAVHAEVLALRAGASAAPHPPSFAELQERRANVTSMFQAKFACAEAKAVGYTCAECRAAGYSFAEALTADYTLREMRAAGYTCKEARSSKIMYRDLRAAGFTCAECKQAGYSLQNCKEAGYSFEEAKAAGLAPGWQPRHWEAGNWQTYWCWSS